MKHLLIVGGGGLGRTIYNIAINSIGYNEVFDIKGFLDFNTTCLDGYNGYPPLLGNEDEYNVEENDVFVIAVGSSKIRSIVANKLSRKGCEFQTLIHKKSILDTNVIIGEGTVLAPNCYIGCDTIIGSNCFVQNNAVIGHDVKIANNCRFDCNCMLVAGTQIGNNVTVHTSAVISHNVTIENNATIGACSFVVRSVKEGITVAGNPARQLPIPIN